MMELLVIKQWVQVISSVLFGALWVWTVGNWVSFIVYHEMVNA